MLLNTIWFVLLSSPVHTQLTFLLLSWFSCSVCPTLCNPMDCSTTGFPVHHQLPELTQTHVHWIDDALWGKKNPKNSFFFSVANDDEQSLLSKPKQSFLSRSDNISFSLITSLTCKFPFIYNMHFSWVLLICQHWLAYRCPKCSKKHL